MINTERQRKWTATFRREDGPEIEAALSQSDLLAEQTIVAVREVGWTLGEDEYATVTLYKTTKAHGERVEDRSVRVWRDERGQLRWMR